MTRDEKLTSILRAKKFIESKNENVNLRNFLDKRLTAEYPLFSHFFVWFECMEFIREFFPEDKYNEEIPNDLAIYIENERKANFL